MLTDVIYPIVLALGLYRFRVNEGSTFRNNVGPT